MTRKERFLRVAAALEQLYPDARCSLFSGNAFELLENREHLASGYS